jgi:seryl-tRNA synthetase
MVREAGSDQQATVRRFPPVLPAATFEASGYLRSFPDLIGAVTSFVGGDRDHAELLRRFEAGHDWTAGLRPAGTVLCSAACHPLYPTLPAALPAGGMVTDVHGWVFRHEPSVDPARMQAFRQYEFVFTGEAAGATTHRDLWRDRAADLLSGVGLDVTVEVASDPFFGRLGRILADSQVGAALKYEVLAPTNGSGRPTAIASANCHEDHFGEAFGLVAGDGTVAHSACVGFGMERIALALFWAHGLDTTSWPQSVRRSLQL